MANDLVDDKLRKESIPSFFVLFLQLAIKKVFQHFRFWTKLLLIVERHHQWRMLRYIATAATWPPCSVMVSLWQSFALNMLSYFLLNCFSSFLLFVEVLSFSFRMRWRPVNFNFRFDHFDTHREYCIFNVCGCIHGTPKRTWDSRHAHLRTFTVVSTNSITSWCWIEGLFLLYKSLEWN